MTRETSATSTGVAAGVAVGSVGGLLAGLSTMIIPGMGIVLAAGPIIATLASAGIGAVTGGLIGALRESGVPHDEAKNYSDGVQRGATLVTAEVTDDLAQQAATIMNENGAVTIDERGAARIHAQSDKISV